VAGQLNSPVVALTGVKPVRDMDQLIEDLQHPLWWTEVLGLLLCLALAWWVSRRMASAMSDHTRWTGRSVTKGFVFPVSNSESAIKKQAQREKANTLTKLSDGKPYNVIDISDDDLRNGLFGSKGKKALIDREDAIQKDKDSKQLTNARKFRDDFVPKMKELAINEYDFAMWIDTNLNSLREQFKKQS
jgi:hypothetical protein